MTQATAPTVMVLEPLKRISPSRFTSMLDCTLREAWSAARNRPLLPLSAASHIGSIAHSLLDRASKGDFRGATREQVEQTWDLLVTAKEAELQDDPIERANLPLRTRVYRYAVRRLRTVKRVIELSAEVKATTGGIPPAGLGSEQWVESHDGLIGGLIDSAVVTARGLTIRDYKTGAVLDDEVGEVLPAYSVQLKLYAGLYREKFGQWPAALELVPLRGEPIDVPFSIEECEGLIGDARRLLGETNECIASDCADLLAAPAPDTCRFCHYRPSCLPYRAARREAAADSSWPRDACGQVISAQQMGDGRIAIRISDDFRGGDPVSVVGLTTDRDRHAAIRDIQPGERLAFFNLRSTAAENTFGETATTIIYPEIAE